MNINYQSTRNDYITATASEAILKGLSPDGGLFVLKDFTTKKLAINDLLHKTYQEIAQEVFKLFLTDFKDELIAECVRQAYDHTFSTPEITPLRKVGDDYLLELFHGKTNAFKDVALSILPHFMDTALDIQQSSRRLLILTATSGDTGKAALEGFKNNQAIDITVFYPSDGVSEIQKLQMQTQAGQNVYVCGIDGNFDDAQTQIKSIFNNQEMIQQLNAANIDLSSANSVNIGRLIPQIVYYVSTYCQLVNNQEITLGECVDFIVPTGNFGNILAGYYAKKLGLPIRHLVCASNDNNVLHDFLQTGIYDARREFLKTTSPSMDILISSNLERLLFDVSDQDSLLVSQWMEKLNTVGYFSVDSRILQKIQETFRSGFTTDEEVKETIYSVYQEHHYLLDPHTAVAYKVMKEQEVFQHKQIVLATASPYKFTESVMDALGLQMSGDLLADMKNLEQETGVKIPDNLALIHDLPILHNDSIEKNKIAEYVIQHVKGE